MKAVVLFVVIILFSCSPDVKTVVDFSGIYYPAENIINDRTRVLQIKKLDLNAFVLKLGTATSVAKEEKGELTGVFKNLSEEERTFTLRMLNDTTAILTDARRSVIFIKQTRK
jgi:hypothetical protein